MTRRYVKLHKSTEQVAAILVEQLINTAQIRPLSMEELRTFEMLLRACSIFKETDGGIEVPDYIKNATPAELRAMLKEAKRE